MENTLKPTTAIVTAIANLGYPINTKPYYLNLFGVRAADCTVGLFNDIIGYFYYDKDNNLVMGSSNGSVDPGTTYVAKPIETDGTAFLKEGSYTCKYEANLKRASGFRFNSIMTVYRKQKSDKVDFALLPTYTERTAGEFGLLIHQDFGMKINTNASAGCQVLNLPSLNTITALAKKTIKLYKTNLFYYSLITEQQVLDYGQNKAFETIPYDFFDKIFQKADTIKTSVTYNIYLNEKQ